jgi:hypothetical protein
LNPSASSPRPAPLFAILVITVLGSVSGGAFWAGLFFVTAGYYRFSPERNLVLATVMGAVYALGAGTSARLFRRVAPRSVLFGALGSWAVAALLPVLWPRAEIALWVSALIGSAASAILWPVVESYLAAGRHGVRMRAAIGWFNITWTPAVAVSLLVMPMLARVGLIWSLALCAGVNVAASSVVFCLTPRPVSHAPDIASATIGPEYPWLARSASWLLPLSYMISSTMAPVLPHRLAAVGIGAPSSVIAALWMAARFATLFLMWRTNFWHGRWGTLVTAGVAMAVGLALVLLATTPAGIVAGLLLCGAGMGLTYYAALYYSMAVGHAAVEAGGAFEARIGVGMCVGPGLGIVGHAVTGSAHRDSATVVLTLLVVALVSRCALGPYLDARRRR